MSEPIPEAIPVSAERHSNSDRPAKKRRVLSPRSKQAAELEALFAKPDIVIKMPTGSVKKELPPPPEIVTNVQGSSAGAGSGEFHVYKASRRREAERIRVMEAEAKKDEADREYEELRAKLKAEDEKKTNKNRARREKMKARKKKAKEAAKTQANGMTNDTANGATNDTEEKKDDGKTERDTMSPMKGAVGKDQNMEDLHEEGVVIHDD